MVRPDGRTATRERGFGADWSMEGSPNWLTRPPGPIRNCQDLLIRHGQAENSSTGPARHRRAHTTQTPRRPIGAGGGEERASRLDASAAHTHALFAQKVKREVSSSIAFFAAAASPLGQQKSGQFLPIYPSRSTRTGSSCVSLRAHLKDPDRWSGAIEIWTSQDCPRLRPASQFSL